MSTIRKKFVLHGLNCANCAAKIEANVKNIDGVAFASMNFATKTLTVEVNNKLELNAIIKKIFKTVNQIESGISITEEGSSKRHNEKPNIKTSKIIRIIFGAVLFLVAIFFKFPERIEFSMYFASYILVGYEVLFKAFRNIVHGQVFDEHFLMSIATIGAFAIKEFPEGVAVMLFYEIGEFFEEIAVNRSRKSISSLMDIRPDFANLKVYDEIKKVPPEEVSVGDIIIIKPGEKVPLDGKVIKGKSLLDTSALTGESLPREIKSGNEILSGSINKNGVLTVKVTKEFGESTVSKILDLVQNASSKKAPTENLITKFAKYYTPVVVFAAAALAVIPPLIIQGATFSEWINRALVFLVVSCPCALVISVPLGFFGGIGAASKHGILIKGSNYLEALNNVDTVVFDKTGTLTMSAFEVTDIKCFNNFDSTDILKYAAYAENYSSHPIALSILKAYDKEIDQSLVSDYNEISGYGIKAIIDGNLVLAGNEKLMLSENIQYEYINEAGTVVHIAVNGKYAGYIVVSAKIKDDSKKAITMLKSIGVKKTIMLTGDNKAISEKIGKDLGLDEIYSELLPNQKVERFELIEKQKAPNSNVIFVGDGINDAPALAQADIGVAMGGVGSDAAIEAADIVLMTDEPSKLIDAIKISKRTHKIIWQNIIFALAVKVIVLFLGAYGIATIWEAVFADVGVTLIAVLNTMRTLKYK
ncbi:MAG: heavy metal translocating P-type ATPase [Bacillota bacterium]|nr:heavy metal translocating P-type ATPase [Bacillota bacterium]